MNSVTEFTSDFLSKAVNEVKKIKPDYEIMLDLYGKIFIAQEKSKSSIRLKDYHMSDDILSLKTREGFPLVDISQFVVDHEASEDLFKELCGILLNKGNELSDSVERVIDIVDSEKLNLNKLFTAFIKGDESFFDTIENDFNIDKKILGFVTYNSVKPSLCVFSQMISRYLDEEKEWDKGYCPICGSMPELSVFGDNGKRSLICGFCNHTWQSRRIYCPFCENADHETLHYYDIEDEEEYRVDVCDKCNRYIKTIDLKKVSRSVYLPLENISTPYVNAKFEEMGFSPGNVINE